MEKLNGFLSVYKDENFHGYHVCITFIWVIFFRILCDGENCGDPDGLLEEDAAGFWHCKTCRYDLCTECGEKVTVSSCSLLTHHSLNNIWSNVFSLTPKTIDQSAYFSPHGCVTKNRKISFVGKKFL